MLFGTLSCTNVIKAINNVTATEVELCGTKERKSLKCFSVITDALSTIGTIR